jgi:hypothetical protein
LAKRIILLTALAAALATPARADLKLIQNVSGKGLGMTAGSVTTTYIKGLKMRNDSVNGDTIRSMIFDVGNQKLYIFDSKKKEAEVWEMADFGAQATAIADPSQMTTSIKPNGQTKQIANKTASGYDMNISMPMRLGDDKNGMPMTVTLSGPVWIVRGAPGTEDYLGFYKAAAEKGFIFGDPRSAKGASGQMKAMTEMYRQLALTGGVPYETEMNIKMGGDGPMAAMMARMGGMSALTTVQSAETSSLEDDLFLPPAGYKLTPRKP